MLRTLDILPQGISVVGSPGRSFNPPPLDFEWLCTINDIYMSCAAATITSFVAGGGGGTRGALVFGGRAYWNFKQMDLMTILEL